MIGLKKVDKAYFKYDKTKIAIFESDVKVKYNNQLYSLSTLATELGNYQLQVVGPMYFTNKSGTTLSDLRKIKKSDL